MTARVLSRLAIIYGSPDSPDPIAWFYEVSRLVAGYSDAEQDRAVDLVTRSHRGRSFPTVSEITVACADARELMNPPKKPAPKYPEWSQEAVSAADTLVACDMGRDAADAGWVGTLHAFCRKHRRLPAKHEIGALIQQAHDFEHAYAKVMRVKQRPEDWLKDSEVPSPGRLAEIRIVASSLERLAEGIIKRRNEIATRAVDGEIR